ncbi:MAG: hypothetical protein ACI4SS_06165 [Clostridia bacterium]
MFKALHFLNGKGTACGFVHVPQTGKAEQWAEELEKMLAVL